MRRDSRIALSPVTDRSTAPKQDAGAVNLDGRMQVTGLERNP